MHRLAIALCMLGAACGQAELGTSIEIDLRYDDSLGLDTAEVIVAGNTQSGAIAHRLMLLVADAQAGSPMTIEVWGRKADKRSAYGTGTAVPVLGKTATATVMLAACSPGCANDVLTSCTGPQVTCEYGCSPGGEARCVGLQLANGIESGDADGLTGTTVITADAVFDTDTGAITGGLVRAPGVGDGGATGIGYLQQPPLEAGGAPLGVFTLANLTIPRDVVVEFTGARAAVILVGDTVRIAGTIDVSGGRGERSTPGPGGGAGSSSGGPAGGCGPGGPGGKDMQLDSGGGGGGGGGIGGRGGSSMTTTRPDVVVPGGASGALCISGDLQVRQLLGGSGGGAGGPGMAPAARGGGGGGAIQISALGQIEVTGIIQAGGAGGEGGQTAMVDAGAGAGGGGGGAIVLEAPIVAVTDTGVLAANGGGGGGGGSVGSPGTPGGTGTNGQASRSPAPGGVNSVDSGRGGDGGAGLTAATAGEGAPSNANGGGGAVGTITIRGGLRMVLGIVSPPAVELELDFTQ